MAITAAMVKDLREATGAGMMDCKKALTATDGDKEKAVEWLREKGLATAQKKAGRIAAEGISMALVSEDGKKAVAVMDKHLSVGAYGPLYPEVVAAVVEGGNVPKMVNYIYGLGGKDVKVSEFMSVFEDMAAGKSKTVNYLGVKE